MRPRAVLLAVLAAPLVGVACGGSTDTHPRSYAGEWVTADTIPGYRGIRLQLSADLPAPSGTWSAVAIREAGSPTKSGEAVGELRGDSVIIRLVGFSHTFRAAPARPDSLHGALVSGGGVPAAVPMYPETPFTSEFGFRRIGP